MTDPFETALRAMTASEEEQGQQRAAEAGAELGRLMCDERWPRRRHPPTMELCIELARAGPRGWVNTDLFRRARKWRPRELRSRLDLLVGHGLIEPMPPDPSRSRAAAHHCFKPAPTFGAAFTAALECSPRLVERTVQVEHALATLPEFAAVRPPAPPAPVTPWWDEVRHIDQGEALEWMRSHMRLIDLFVAQVEAERGEGHSLTWCTYVLLLVEGPRPFADLLGRWRVRRPSWIHWCDMKRLLPTTTGWLKEHGITRTSTNPRYRQPGDPRRAIGIGRGFGLLLPYASNRLDGWTRLRATRMVGKQVRDLAVEILGRIPRRR